MHASGAARCATDRGVAPRPGRRLDPSWQASKGRVDMHFVFQRPQHWCAGYSDMNVRRACPVAAGIETPIHKVKPLALQYRKRRPHHRSAEALSSST